MLGIIWSITIKSNSKVFSYDLNTLNSLLRHYLCCLYSVTKMISNVLNLIWKMQSILWMLCIVFLVSILIQFISADIRRSNLVQIYECKSISTVHQLDGRLDFLFLWKNVRNLKERRFLQSWNEYLVRNERSIHFWFFDQRHLVTSDSENVKTILISFVNDFELESERRREFAFLFEIDVFVVNDEHWRQTRALLRSSFVKRELSDVQVFETHFQRFLSALSADEETIEFQNLLNNLTLKISKDLIFDDSSRFNIENSHFFSVCDVAIRDVFRNVIFERLNIILDQTSRRAKSIVHDIIDRHVQRALINKAADSSTIDESSTSKKRSRYVFIQHFTKRIRDSTFLRYLSLNVLLVEKDTTASLLGNLFYILARRPDIWTKLQIEVRSFFSQFLNQDTIKSVICLSQCLNESKCRNHRIKNL